MTWPSGELNKQIASLVVLVPLRFMLGSFFNLLVILLWGIARVTEELEYTFKTLVSVEEIVIDGG